MKNVHLCPFMSIYVHLCCNMGDILIIQTKISGVKNWKMSIYVHLCCSMGDMLIIQMGRKQISTKWRHILSGVAFEFNCIIGKTHILCGRGTLYIYMYVYSHDMKWPWIAGITPFSKQGISFSCSGLSSEVSTYSMAWGKETTNHGLFRDTRGNTAKVLLNRLMLWRTLKR